MVELPEVNVHVYSEDGTVKVAFNKNIALLNVSPKMALKMADMMKLEAVRIMRRSA